MNSKELNELKIFKGTKVCGYLRRRSDGGAEFQYDSGYLSNDVNPELCFNMKKRTEPYIQHGVNLHPYFAGLLPEGLRLKFLIQKIKTSSDDLFSLFAGIGSDCIGDVYAQSINQQQSMPVSSFRAPSWKDINFYDYFLRSLTDSTITDNSEFAGVQEKISASMITLPFNLKNKGSYILKLNPKDKPNLVYNEWVSLYLAQLCKINVNEFQLIEDRDRNLGLLVKRFDRDFFEDKIIRLHQEDLCQVLNLFPAEKYRVSMKDIFSAVQKYSTAPIFEIYNLTRLITFSYLIGNGDLHAKNISLIESYGDGRIGLSPAYDLICTLIYGDQKMALKLDAKDGNIKRKDLIRFATRFGLTQSTVEKLIDELLNTFFYHHHILFSISDSDNRLNFLALELKKRMDGLSS